MSALAARRRQIEAEADMLRAGGAQVELSPCGTWIAAWTDRAGRRHEELPPAHRPWEQASAAPVVSSDRKREVAIEWALEVADARERKLERDAVASRRHEIAELAKTNPARARLEELMDKAADLGVETADIRHKLDQLDAFRAKEDARNAAALARVQERRKHS